MKNGKHKQEQIGNSNWVAIYPALNVSEEGSEQQFLMEQKPQP